MLIAWLCVPCECEDDNCIVQQNDWLTNQLTDRTVTLTKRLTAWYRPYSISKVLIQAICWKLIRCEPCNDIVHHWVRILCRSVQRQSTEIRQLKSFFGQTFFTTNDTFLFEYFLILNLLSWLTGKSQMHNKTKWRQSEEKSYNFIVWERMLKSKNPKERKKF